MVNLFDHKSCRYLSIDRSLHEFKHILPWVKHFFLQATIVDAFFSLVFMISVDLYPSIILQSKLK